MQRKQKAKYGDRLKGEQRCMAVNDQRARVTYSRSWALKASKAWWLEARYRLQLFVPFLVLTTPEVFALTGEKKQTNKNGGENIFKKTF